jgi:hypothetical protein
MSGHSLLRRRHCNIQPGRAIAQAVSHRLPGFDPKLHYVGYVAEKVALGQVLSEYFGFPCQFVFDYLLHIQ